MNSHFDSIAYEYDETLPAHVQLHYLHKRIAFITSHVPRGLALDVGCGTGVLAELLRGKGFEVVGVDSSVGMLRLAQDRKLTGIACADGARLPFKDGTFDLTFCVAVLHHVAVASRVASTLAEMARVTAAGGYVLVWDHNPRNPYWPLLMRRVPQDVGTERLVPEKEIVSGLHKGGAYTISSQQLGLVPDFAPRSLLPVAAMVERVFESIPVARRLCAHNVVLARRSSIDSAAANTVEMGSQETA